MLRYVCLALLLLTGCPDQRVEQDAGQAEDTGGMERDSGLVDTGAPPDDAGVEDAGVEDAGVEDAGEADAGTPDTGNDDDAGPRVVPIRVAYSAAAEMPLLAELYLTESSTTRYKVTPALAGGPPVGGKGEPFTSGVDRFEWTSDGGIIYSAHQDNFDFYEIYFAPDPGFGQTFKLSVEGASSEVSDWDASPASDWIAFAQSAGTTRNLYAVRTSSSAQPVQISSGSAGTPRWSPVGQEVVFQDIIVSASDRDLWHANLAVAPPVLTRVNPGANLGFGSSVSWAPDGSAVAYSADETALRLFELWRASITNGVVAPGERMTPPFPADADVSGSDAVKFSPDGTRLAYIADTVTDNVKDLFVMDPSQPVPPPQTQLTTAFPAGASGVDRFSWSEDGTRIAYVADHDTAGLDELYVTSANAADGVRVNAPLGAGQSLAHERFIRNDTMLLYTVYDGTERRVFVVDISITPFGEPVDLGPTEAFFPVALYELSPSGDFLIHPDGAAPPGLRVSDLTGTPTTSVVLPTIEAPFSFESKWCWSPDDELLIVGADGHLYLVEDLTSAELFRVSGPIVSGGRVWGCAFPPNQRTN